MIILIYYVPDVRHTKPVSKKANLTTKSGLCPFPYVNPETLEFAYCDAYYQYI